MAYAVSPYYTPCVSWNVLVPQPASPQIYYYYVPSAWTCLHCSVAKCCCVSCCCCCCRCSSKTAVTATQVSPQPAEVVPPAAVFQPRSGTVQLEGQVQIQSKAPESSRRVDPNRKKDVGEAEKGWRRVSSLPRMRAEKAAASEDSCSSHSSRNQRRGDRGRRRQPSPEGRGRCEGTLIIKGLPMLERKEEKKSPTESRERECMLRGMLTFSTQ